MTASNDSTVFDDARPSPEKTNGFRIWLYNRDGDDRPLDLDDGPLADLSEGELLWIDVDLDYIDRLSNTWKELNVEEVVASLEGSDHDAQILQHDDLVELRVATLGDGTESEPMTLHCLVSANWIVTLHQGELDLVDEFNKPFHGDTDLGGLDGPAFLSMVLDWQLGGYFNGIEDLHGEIDRIDEKLLSTSADEVTDEVTLLQGLQVLRRRVRQLRQAMSSQRELFGLLSHPESDALIASKHAPDYERLSDRLQQALDALDTTREMIVGSFEMFMTRTAQATNDIMKRLTIITVLLLPAGVIAGIMGMNFRIGIFEEPWMFWVVIGSMAVLAAVTLIVAKRNKWI